MKIDYLKINGFGKIINKEINFSDNINVIYGENESGKSTIEKFIDSMFFGISRTKNGKDITDIEKYTPWKTEDYSGKISYTLDDGKSYEVFRDFKKKNPIIYDSLKEDITKNYSNNKIKGINFVQEQMGIDEETYKNTAISEQEGLRLSQSSQNAIIQKISNLVTSGDDKVSYKKSMEKLKNRQNEEIGTDRTLQRPINVIDNKLRKLINEKGELESYKEETFKVQNEKEEIKEQIRNEEIKFDFLNDIRKILEENRVKSLEVNANRLIEDQYTQKIEELNDKIEDDAISAQYEKVSYKWYYIFSVFFILICIVLMLIKPNMFNLFALVPILPIVLHMIFKRNKIKREKETREFDKMKLFSELDVLSKTREDQKLQYEKNAKFIEEELKKKKEAIVLNYLGKLEANYIDDCLNMPLEKINSEIEAKQSRINSNRFKLQTIEGQSRDINNKLEELSEIEEEIEKIEEEKGNLLSLNNSYNIARESMEKAYAKAKENISPRFVKNLCKIISKISNGRYKNVMINDQDGLNVEIENGKYIPASRLSVGTVDQMYLSLRLGSLREVSKERMPIILDESFVHFDEIRLANILKYLNKEFSKNQILIFTCSRREADILDNMKIEYNLVKL